MFAGAATDADGVARFPTNTRNTQLRISKHDVRPTSGLDRYSLPIHVIAHPEAGNPAPPAPSSSPLAALTVASSAQRVAAYCPSQNYDLKGAQLQLEAAGHRCEVLPGGALHARLQQRNRPPARDAFVFSNGAVVMWMHTMEREHRILEGLKPFERGSTAPRQAAGPPAAFVQADSLALCCTDPCELPFILDGVVHVGSEQASTDEASMPYKLALSLALAQSTRLAALEGRVAALAAVTRHVPLALAKHGDAKLGEREAARLQGATFVERRQLTLLVGAAVPAALRRGPADARRCFAAARTHLEVGARAAVAEARLCAMQAILEQARRQAVAAAGERSELAIILLILAEVVILVVQLAGTVGWSPLAG